MNQIYNKIIFDLNPNLNFSNLVGTAICQTLGDLEQVFLDLNRSQTGSSLSLIQIKFIPNLIQKLTLLNVINYLFSYSLKYICHLLSIAIFQSPPTIHRQL